MSPVTFEYGWPKENLMTFLKVVAALILVK